MDPGRLAYGSSRRRCHRTARSARSAARAHRAAARRRAVRVTIVAVVIVALVFFVFRVNWAQTWSAIRASSPAILVLAALVNMLSLALTAVRWWLFLRAAGAPSLRLALRATVAGAALN